jgi:hypothetical protein
MRGGWFATELATAPRQRDDANHDCKPFYAWGRHMSGISFGRLLLVCAVLATASLSPPVILAQAQPVAALASAEGGTLPKVQGRAPAGIDPSASRPEAELLSAKAPVPPPDPPAWLTAGATVLAAVIAVAGVSWTARNGIRQAMEGRVGTLDAKLYDARSTAYAKLVEAMQPLATQRATRLTAQECESVADELQRLYYSGSGLLLGSEARRWWSCLVALLATAGRTGIKLNVPESGRAYAEQCRDDLLNEHRCTLGLTMKNRWKSADEERAACYTVFDERTLHADTEAIRHYVVLQFAASRLRSALAGDLSSRRPIGDLR